MPAPEQDSPPTRSTLDQMIRDYLDHYAEFRNHDGHQLANAVRAVLDIQDWPSNDPEGLCWNRALDVVRQTIAVNLGAPDRCALEFEHEGECTP